MEINDIVIHELIKDQNTESNDVEVNLSEHSVTLDEKTTELLQSLNDSFDKRSPKRGKLADNGFKEIITDFNNIDLVNNSQALTKQLKEQIKNVTLAKGGYLLFCKYAVNNSFLSVFLLRNTTGALFEKNGDTFGVRDTTHIDIDKFAMGVRINLTLLNANSDDRYVQLSRGNTDISKYFETWIGLDDTRQENKDGEALYELTNTLPLADGETRDDLRKKIHSFAKGSNNHRINLRELSGYLYDGNQDRINEFISDDMDIDGEFSLKGKILWKFYRVSAKGDGIEISAKRDLFSDQSVISIQDNSLIIHSQSLVNSIQEQLDSE